MLAGQAAGVEDEIGIGQRLGAQRGPQQRLIEQGWIEATRLHRRRQFAHGGSDIAPTTLAQPQRDDQLAARGDKLAV